MCSITVMFSEAARVMSANHRYSCVNDGSSSPCVHAATAFVQLDIISVNPSYVLAQNWHNETIQTRVLVGRRFCSHGNFCRGREYDVRQCGGFGER